MLGSQSHAAGGMSKRKFFSVAGLIREITTSDKITASTLESFILLSSTHKMAVQHQLSPPMPGRVSPMSRSPSQNSVSSIQLSLPHAMNHQPHVPASGPAVGVPKPNASNSNSNSNGNSNSSAVSNSAMPPSLPPPPNHNGSSPWCQNCQTSNTPLWRRNEYGQILCNACGLFLKLHGRPRPISLKTNVIKSRNRSKVNNNGNTTTNPSANSSPTTTGTSGSSSNPTSVDKEKLKAKNGVSKARKRPSSKRNSTGSATGKDTTSEPPTPALDPTTALTPQKVVSSNSIPIPNSQGSHPFGANKIEADLIDSLAHLKQGGPYSSSNNPKTESFLESSTLPPLQKFENNNPKRTALPSLRDSPLLSPLINATYSSNNFVSPHTITHVTTSTQPSSIKLPALPDTLSSNVHIHSSSTHGSGVLASLRGSYHGTPIADSIISSNALKAITSPLLLATTNSSNGLPSVISSLALKNSSGTNLSGGSIPSVLPTALDQLTSAACKSPYLAPIPQQSDTRGSIPAIGNDKKILQHNSTAPTNPSILSNSTTNTTIESDELNISPDRTSPYYRHTTRISSAEDSMSSTPSSTSPTSSAAVLNALKNPMSAMMSSSSLPSPSSNTIISTPRSHFFESHTTNDQHEALPAISISNKTHPLFSEHSSIPSVTSVPATSKTIPSTSLAGSSSSLSALSTNLNNIQINSPTGDSSSPIHTSGSSSSLETRVAELEFVNDLLRTRVSELEHSESNARRLENIAKQSEVLIRQSEMHLRLQLSEMDSKLVEAEREMKHMHAQLMKEKDEKLKVEIELKRLKGEQVDEGEYRAINDLKKENGGNDNNKIESILNPAGPKKTDDDQSDVSSTSKKGYSSEDTSDVTASSPFSTSTSRTTPKKRNTDDSLMNSDISAGIKREDENSINNETTSIATSPPPLKKVKT